MADKQPSLSQTTQDPEREHPSLDYAATASPVGVPWRSARSRPEIEEIRGVARYVEFRPAPASFGAEGQDRLTFHLYSLGASEQTVRKTRVEMRSDRIGDLTLRDGDTVVVRGTRAKRNDLLATSVHNLTARSQLSLRSEVSIVDKLKTPLSVLWFAAIPVFILAMVALICNRVGVGASLGLPCVAIWFAFWLLYRRSA